MIVGKIDKFEVGTYNEYNNGLDKDSLKKFFSSLDDSLKNEESEEKRKKILQEAWTFIRNTASSVLSVTIARQLFNQ